MQIKQENDIQKIYFPANKKKQKNSATYQRDQYIVEQTENVIRFRITYQREIIEKNTKFYDSANISFKIKVS